MMLALCPESGIRPRWHLALAAISVATSAFVFASWISYALPMHAVQWIKWLLVAPVIEELFFRGVVQAGLRARADLWGRPWIAIAVTAACFGLAHLSAASAVHSAWVVAPALVIGWAFERFRSLLLCIGLHSAFNAIGFVLRGI